VLSQSESEKGLAYSLLRRPGEDAEDALQRVASLPIAIEPEDISDPVLRSLAAVVLDNAAGETATGTRLAAQATGIDEFTLLQGVESVDHNALRIYAEAVAYHSARRQITSAAEDAVESARLQSPGDALDQIGARFAGISLGEEDERVASVSQRLVEGHQARAAWQEEVASGKPRISFPLSRLDETLPVLPGDLILLSAATKVGKSSFAGQFFDLNLKRGMRGVLFHFEDTIRITYARRIARQMARFDGCGPTYKQLLYSMLSPEDLEYVRLAEESITEWADRGTEVYCAGWTMEQVIRTWRRLCLKARAEGRPIDFVVIDYLNKAELLPQKIKAYGLFAARGQDAELIKRTAEATGVTALLLQQEGDEGKPYETRQTQQKAQIHLRLLRERLPSGRLSPTGELRVESANNSETGAVSVELLPGNMLWREL